MTHHLAANLSNEPFRLADPTAALYVPVTFVLCLVFFPP